MAGKRYFTAGDPRGVTPSRLKRLGRATQLEYMEEWFREYYEDPANETSRLDGEFVYLWGGPYDALDELGNEFGDLVPEDRIEELARELRQEHINWAPTSRKRREMEEDEPVALPDQAPKTDDVPFFSGLVSGSEFLPNLGAGVARRAAALEPDRSFFWTGVPNTPTATSTLTEPAAGQGTQDPPRVPPSDGDTGGASSPDPNASFAGEGGFGAYPSILPASAQQRPAAYRFEQREGKIDVLPEAPEPEDREFAFDTYHELVAKVRELHDHLRGTNSAGPVFRNVERLLAALGTRFDDVTVGVLLSRSRSLEADLSAFSDQLFPDVIAMMDGTARTLRDLLAVFPKVRRIEAEVLALDLDRIADAVPTIREQMGAIKAAAEKSEAVTEEAIRALTQNDVAIEDAIDPVVQRRLVADKLLVIGNFARTVIGGIASCGRTVGTEFGELVGKSWQAIKDELPKGIGAAARIAPLVGLVTLAGVIAGPVASVASAVPAFKPIADTLKDAIKDGLKGAFIGEAKGNPKGKTRRKGP